MLNFGLWSSSKGMGIIPNLEGLTLNEARTAITNAGFALGNETSIGNSNGANSSNNGKAKARVDTGSLLQYESTIDFEYYSYVVVPTPPAPTPPAPTPVAPTPVAPTPVAPTPVAPVAPTPTAPQLATPSLSITSSGYNSYPNQVYANIGIGNYDYQNTYTTSSAGWTQNPEFPEEWSIQNISPNSSQTVYITASRPGYTSATGSLTFTSHYVAPVAPVAPVASNAYYAIGCCSGTLVYGSSNVSAANAYDNVDGACINGTISVWDVSYNNTGTYPTIECSQTPTPVAPVAPTPVAPTPVAPTPTAPTTGYYAYGCCNGDPLVIDGPNNPTARAEYQSVGGCTAAGVLTTYDAALTAATAACNSQSPVAPVAPTPVAPTPVAPTPTAPTPTATCPPNDGRTYTNTRTTTNTCADLGLTYVCTDGQFQYCLAATPTPTAPAPVAPTPVAPTPLPCSTSNGNCGSSPCSDCDPGRSGPQPDSGCPSGYRNVCWTGGSCPNTGDCVPVTPTAPAPTAPAPTAPAPTAPAPTAPAPTAPAPTECVANCVFDGYTCSGWNAIYTYINYGCGGASACPPYTDPYGCA